MTSGERIIEKLKIQLGRLPTADEIFQAANGSGLLSDSEFDKAVERAKEEIKKDSRPGREIREILRESKSNAESFDKFMRDYRRGGQ